MIDNTQDLIDSRGVIARIEELSAELVELDDAVDYSSTDYADAAHELRSLMKLAAEASDYADDWEYGVTLVRDSYFKDYAIQLADDIGAVDDNYSWPNSHIDWEAAADALKQDYTAVDFDGVTYWVH